MKNLKISLDAAIVAHTNATKNGKVLLENLFGKKVFLKSLEERINSFEDILEELGITVGDFNKQCEGLPVDEVAFKQAKLITQVLNEGWIPNWKNKNEQKWFIWWYIDEFRFHHCSYYSENSNVPLSLCFKSEKLINIVKNNKEFTEIFKKFMLGE